jgi:acyl-homoserine-lactone acylase
MRFPVLILASLTISLAANAAAADKSYQAHIRRTTYGIPHIEARDLGSLGFGDGYAQAEDHLCSIADQVVRVRGERARYFGAGTANEHLNNDVTMKGLDLEGDAAKEIALMSTEARQWNTGFVAGYNTYLAKTGKANVAGWCRNADWVFPITLQDLAAYQRLLSLTVANLPANIATAEPPALGAAPTSSGNEELAALNWPQPDLGASNGWAIGGAKSESGRGMLLANPHYPWVGSNRFWEKHLRIPGKLDIYGVSLIGMPGVAIGFNDQVAWTHTVSAGKRITFYTLDLVPGKPTSYRYGNSERAMTSRKVTIAVRQSGGSIKSVDKDVWFTHYGPVLNMPNLGWTAARAITVRDANWNNTGRIEQYLWMDRARSMKDLQDAHARFQGMMWVNTIAAAADGTAWYADTAATPKLSDEAIAEWLKRREKDPLATSLWRQGGNVILDGSDPRFEWVTDPAAYTPGLVPYRDQPKIERTDYVFNSNDSFWLENSSAPIEGSFSPLHGEQRTARSLRTRNNDLTLSGNSPDHPAGDNGKFNLDELGNAILSNRSLAGEMLRDELVSRCRRTPSVTVDGAPVDLTAACNALAAWDLRNNLDSRGSVLFREFMGRYEPADLQRKGPLWAVDFKPNDPDGTPNTLTTGPLALENLARAAQLLLTRGLTPDVSLGEIQYADKAGRHIPIHGGDGAYDGLMNMQRNSRNTTTLEPMDNPPPVKGSRFLTAKGYPVVHGSSFLMALEFTAAGPQAKAFLTYSESGDPDSKHFTDQTELFSNKQWRPILYRESDIRKSVERDYKVRN